MPKKMPGRLVALSTSAVATIYFAGLLSTQTAAQSVAAASAGGQTAVLASPVATLSASAADPTSTPGVVVGASATATLARPSSATPTTASSTTTPVSGSTPAANAMATTSTSTAASTSTSANGTYSATGTSRFGNVSVAVTTAGGKITNVQITKVTTSFPVSRIASLPSQVVQNQTANVNTVTGATYSSQAFKQAIQQALAQALAANSATVAG